MEGGSAGDSAEFLSPAFSFKKSSRLEELCWEIEIDKSINLSFYIPLILPLILLAQHKEIQLSIMQSSKRAPLG